MSSTSWTSTWGWCPGTEAMELSRRRTFVASIVLAAVLASGGLLFTLMRNEALYDANIHMKYLMVALQQYASEYGNGHLPPQSGYRGLLVLYSLGMLGQNDTRLLLDPRRLSGADWSGLTEADVAYWYLGGRRLDDSADSIVLVQKKGGEWGYVGYLDGRILYVSGERWSAIRGSMVETGRGDR